MDVLLLSCTVIIVLVINAKAMIEDWTIKANVRIIDASLNEPHPRTAEVFPPQLSGELYSRHRISRPFLFVTFSNFSSTDI